MHIALHSNVRDFLRSVTRDAKHAHVRARDQTRAHIAHEHPLACVFFLSYVTYPQLCNMFSVM